MNPQADALTRINRPDKKDDPMKIKPGDSTGYNNDNITSSRRGSTDSTKAKREEKQYNYNLIPPNIELGQIHRRSRMVHSAISMKDQNKKRQSCECCGNPIDLDPIPLCCDMSELYHLGAGYPLYY